MAIPRKRRKKSMKVLLIGLGVFVVGFGLAVGYRNFEGIAESPNPVNGESWSVGDEVPPEVFAKAESLSAGKKLDIVPGQTMFFSNVPEMVKEPGIMTRVDNCLSKSGDVRLLYSHFNLLIDYSGKNIRNVPAQMGVAIVNRTQRVVDVYYKRLANGISRKLDGTRIYEDDLAPMKPGETIPVYYGTQLGNVVFANYLKQNPQEQLWSSLKPGEKSWIYDKVGIHGWAIMMGDFVFRDHATGQLLTLDNIRAGEAIGIRSFVAPIGEDLDAFYQANDKPNSILNQAPEEAFHMRGLITDGITRKMTLPYNSQKDGLKTLTLNSALDAQAVDPSLPGFEPAKFQNDLTSGTDEYGSKNSKGQIQPLPVQNNGSYGAMYEVTLNITGPTAIAIQGSAPHSPGLAYVDLYNQFITAGLDSDPENVRTVRLVDPNYFEYYSHPQKLRPLGYGSVFYVLPEKGRHTHTLHIGLAPNSYAPFKVVLMPLNK
ncbi:hypothetical protein GJ688_07120 [Heliobacillus mobilis]|uniref:Uncharacterized protein n=1 Tax=Heliobacterium mobile TaxID=28064 RepID=A0A6I3SIS8_HELMO|nr:hypothetical protein [Heliobacterium mobile]MTV48750.1 hypothetical protein [Heliobacterium mobile]